MAAKIKNNLPGEIDLINIEPINISVDFYASAAKRPVNFKYILDIETKANKNESLVYKIVSVQITNDKRTLMYGSLAISCVFHISEFSSLVSIDNSGNISVAKNLSVKLDTISVSTLRGVMFSSLKGSLLHNAILPAVELKF